MFFRAFLFCEQKKGSVAVKTFSMKMQTRKMLYQEKKKFQMFRVYRIRIPLMWVKL